jgi:hypothetical protein
MGNLFTLVADMGGNKLLKECFMTIVTVDSDLF